MPSLQFTIGADASPVAKAIAKVTRATKQMGAQFGKAAKGMSAEMGKYTQSVQQAAAEVDRFVGQVGGTLKTSLTATTAVLGAGAAAVGGFGAAILKTGSQLEGLEAQLQVLTGSTEAGTARFEELFNIGASTPFEVTDLVAAEATLRALGANAEEALPLVMDFAGAMNTDLKSAALDVGRGMMFGAGAVETMAGRALRAQVELATGQDALKMSTEEFRGEMIKTLQDTDGIFAGGTAKLAGTISGIVSNVQDEWTRFAKAVNDSGLFAAVKAGLRTALDLVSQNRATVQQLAKDVGVGLYAAIQVTLNAADKLLLVWYKVQLAVNAIKGLVRAFDVATRKAIGWLIDKIDKIVRAGADFLGIDQTTVDQVRDIASSIGLAGMALDGVTEYAAGIETAEAALRDSVNSSATLKEDMKAARDAVADISTSMEAAFNVAQSEGTSQFDVIPSTAGGGGGSGPKEADKAAEKAAKKAQAERERVEKEIADLHKNLMQQAEEVGLEEAALLELRYQREVQATAAKFDEFSALYQDDAAKQLEIEAMKLEAMGALQETHLARVAEMQQEAREAQRDAVLGMTADLISATQTAASAYMAMQQNAIQETTALLENSESELTSAQRKELEKRNEQQKKRAMVAFRVSQTAALAQIAVDTATAIQRSMAIYGPTPLGIAGGIVAGVSGAAAAASVLSQQPSFHRGTASVRTERYHTGTSGAPDEVSATLLQKEAVLTSTGQDQVTQALMNGANRGDSLGMGGGGHNTTYKHRVFGELGRDNRRAGGVIAEAQSNGAKVGRRQRVRSR